MNTAARSIPRKHGVASLLSQTLLSQSIHPATYQVEPHANSIAGREHIVAATHCGGEGRHDSG